MPMYDDLVAHKLRWLAYALEMMLPIMVVGLMAFAVISAANTNERFHQAARRSDRNICEQLRRQGEGNVDVWRNALKNAGTANKAAAAKFLADLSGEVEQSYQACLAGVGR